MRPVSELLMPDGLHAALSKLSPSLRTTAVDNWVFIGPDGRSAYRRYLDRALTERALRKRCDLAAVQLVDPEIGYNASSGGGC